MNQIFDITVTNDGTCPLNNIGLNFDYNENANITQQWNLVNDVRYTLLSNFGPTLDVGVSVTAGFVLSIPQADFASLSADVHVYGAACPSTCNNTSSAPSSAPSAAPTSASSPTSAPSAAPTSAGAPFPQCEGNAQAVARAGQAPWTDAQGFTYQIYDIIANNTGSCPWTTIAAYFAGNITQAWNYDIPSGLLSGYGTQINGGQVYTGAGFVFATSPNPVIGSASGLTAPVLARMVNRCGAPCSS